MARPKKTRQPEWLKNKAPPVHGDSPWWRSVMQELLMRPGLVGSQVEMGALTETLPCYPNGRRPKPRTAARRLAPILQLVERGSNGSLARATYRIVRPPEVRDAPADPFVDEEWLEQAIQRTMRGK